MTQKTFRIFIYVILLTLSILFISKFWDEIQSVRIVSWESIIPIILLFIATTILNGYMNFVIWEKQDLKVKFVEWYGLSVANSFLNIIFPMRGGLLTVAAYLKSKHSFSYSKYISFLSASYIIIFFVNSLGGLLSLIYLWLENRYLSIPLSAFFICSTFFLLFIILISPQINPTQNRFINKFIEVIDNWRKIKDSKILLLKMFIISVLNLVVMAGLIKYEFQALGFNVRFLNSLILCVIGGFSLLLSITPGNLGVKEGFYALVSTTLGIAAWQTVVVSVFDRLISFFILLGITPYYIIKLSIGVFRKDDKSKCR